MAAGTTDFPWSLHAIIAMIVDKLVWFCALLPYGVIALLVRIVMARVFFLAGQDKISGPRIPLHVSLPGSDLTLLDLTVILPAEIKDSTLQLFETQYAYSPVPGAVAAYLVTCDSLWQTTAPHGGVRCASASALAAVPVPTRKTASSCSNISASLCSRRWVHSSRP
jgi:hypothetical protein